MGGDRAPPAPSRLLSPAAPPAGKGFLSPARPAGSTEPRGGDGEEGPGAAGASCRRPRRGRAERGGSSARPGPAERRSRAEPNFPRGSDIYTRAHIYRYLIFIFIFSISFSFSRHFRRGPRGGAALAAGRGRCPQRRGWAPPGRPPPRPARLGSARLGPARRAAWPRSLAPRRSR